MFELFMMCLFAGIGMLLGNLVFNCIVALSDSMEFYFDTNEPSNNFRHRKKLLTSDTVKNANQIINDRKFSKNYTIDKSNQIINNRKK